MNTKKMVVVPWWRTVFSMALGSAIFLTILNIVDSVINSKYAIAPDKLTAASAYLLIGGWFGVIICLVLGKVLTIISKRMGLNTETKTETAPRWKASPTVLAVIAGILGAATTLISLWGYQHNDLGVMVALTNAFLIVVVILEWRRGRVTLRQFLLPSVMVIGSIVLVAYNAAWRHDISILLQQAPVLLFVLISFSILNAYGVIVSKEAVDHSNSVNIQIIRFVTLAIAGTIIAIGWSALRGQLVELQAASIHILTTPAVYFWLVLLFVAVFLSQVLELQAKKQNENASEVVIVQSLNVGMGFLAAFLINALSPGAVGPVPTDPETVVVRTIGVVGLMLALALLQRKKAK